MTRLMHIVQLDGVKKIDMVAKLSDDTEERRA